MLVEYDLSKQLLTKQLNLKCLLNCNCATNNEGSSAILNFSTTCSTITTSYQVAKHKILKVFCLTEYWFQFVK